VSSNGDHTSHKPGKIALCASPLDVEIWSIRSWISTGKRLSAVTLRGSARAIVLRRITASPAAPRGGVTTDAPSSLRLGVDPRELTSRLVQFPWRVISSVDSAWLVAPERSCRLAVLALVALEANLGLFARGHAK
jgi:hypothetical protein